MNKTTINQNNGWTPIQSSLEFMTLTIVNEGTQSIQVAEGPTQEGPPPTNIDLPFITITNKSKPYQIASFDISDDYTLYARVISGTGRIVYYGRQTPQ